MKSFKKTIIAAAVACVVGIPCTLAIAHAAAQAKRDPAEPALPKQDIAAQYYSVTPQNTEEWAKLKTNQDQLDVLQLKESDLKDLSTEELLEVCLAYPKFADFLCFNTCQEGFERVVKGFNGLQELLEREDVGTAMLEKYRSMDLGEVLETKKYPSLYMMFFELMMSQDTVLNSMTEAQREEVVRLSSEMLEKKDVFADRFSHTESLLLAARSLRIDDAEFRAYVENDEEFSKFLETSDLRADIDELKARIVQSIDD